MIEMRWLQSKGTYVPNCPHEPKLQYRTFAVYRDASGALAPDWNGNLWGEWKDVPFEMQPNASLTGGPADD